MLELENQQAHLNMQERELGYWTAAGKYQMTAHEHVDDP